MPPNVIESIVALKGLAVLFVIFLGKPRADGSPLVAHPSDASSTDIVTTDSSKNLELQVGGDIYQDPWMLLGIPHPSEGILLDSHTLQEALISRVVRAQQVGASLLEIQGLQHAYLAVLNATAFLLRDRQYHEARNARPIETSMIASEDVKRFIKHLEKDRNAFADHAGNMEHWGSFVMNDLKSSKSKIMELEGLLEQTKEQARCAPAWFGAWLEFVRLRCVQGDDKRVGSMELHEAFIEFMRSHHPQGEAPTHKPFRELLEHLGYEYDQIYVNGSNKRGFRGVTLLKLTP